jgi:hypothetical protein
MLEKLINTLSNVVWLPFARRYQYSWVAINQIPRECGDKDMAAMLVPSTKELLLKSFVDVFQHGTYDVTCNQR